MEVLAELNGFLGHGAFDGLNLEAMETIIKKEALNIATRFLEKMLNADASDYAGPSVTCIFCGAQARYVDRRAKIITSLGEITIERAYYNCPSCGHGWCPKDAALGFGDSSLSPAVIRMVGLVASAGSFLEGSKLLSNWQALTLLTSAWNALLKNLVRPSLATRLPVST